MPQSFYCNKCGKTMSETKFFKYRDGSACELCKSCITMHLDTYDEKTYLWLMEKFDIPYLPWEWKKKRETEYQKAFEKAKASGASDPQTVAFNNTRGNSVVFGKYLSSMKLTQHMNERWADSERLQKEAEEKAALHGFSNLSPEEAEKKQIEMKQALDNGEISEAEYLTYMEINPEKQKMKSLEDMFFEQTSPKETAPSNTFEVVEVPDVGTELTIDDKIYLAMKWGQLYTAADWVYLEKKYNDFMNSFDIQSAATKDTLIMICKTSLKMNQAIDCGDIDSYQKLSRVYDAMMKAAKFTEAQNKEDNAGDFDAIGCIVAFCEKEGGFIPRFYTATPQDQVDVVIADEKSYAKSLFDGDAGLAQQIEQYIKKREILEEQKRNKELARLQGKDTIEISDEDYQEFLQQEEEEKEKDFQSVYNEDENEEGEE